MDYKDNIIFHVNVLNRIITLKANRLLAGSGLECGSFFLLTSLYKASSFNVTEQALNMYSDRTTISRLLANLLKNGYVQSAEKDDRRSFCHIITNSGRKTVEKYFPLLNDLHECLLEQPSLLSAYQLIKDNPQPFPVKQ